MDHQPAFDPDDTPEQKSRALLAWMFRREQATEEVRVRLHRLEEKLDSIARWLAQHHGQQSGAAIVSPKARRAAGVVAEAVARQVPAVARQAIDALADLLQAPIGPASKRARR